MPGVIDEFLIKIGLEPDVSGLASAFKTIKKQQDSLEEDSAKNDKKELDRDKKKGKRKENLHKLHQRVNKAASTGVALGKRGVSMARNWAVALLAVDGAAMAVIGRLSQMAVEYDNLAGATNTSASELKAWEDAFKSVGGKATDVQGAFSSLYDIAFDISRGNPQAGSQEALAAFDVQTHIGGRQRETGDIFSDVIQGYRDAIERGMDPNMALGYLKALGISGELSRPMLAQEGGQYLINEDVFSDFLKKAKPLDELADASMGLTGVITELSATFREKFAKVLLELVESGTLEKIVSQLNKLVEGIDVDGVAEAIDKFIALLGKLFDWMEAHGPQIQEGVEVAGRIGTAIVNPEKANEEATNIAMSMLESQKRSKALVSALEEHMPSKEFRKWRRGAMAFGSESGVQISEGEAVSQINALGLDPTRILRQADMPELNNTINVWIDGKDIPFTREEYKTYSVNPAEVNSGAIQ